jgi:hypothetical protein
MWGISSLSEKLLAFCGFHGVGWLAGWLVGRLVGGLVGWLAGRPGSWLVGWLAGHMVGSFVGWFICLFIVCTYVYRRVSAVLS